MRGFISGVLLGVIIGAGGLWYFQQRQAGELRKTQETDGVVTLSGTVASPALAGRAVLVALETGDVREVIAPLKVAKK